MAPEFNRKYHTGGMAPEYTKKILTARIAPAFSVKFWSHSDSVVFFY
jgi:hypothetical protein